MENKIEIRDLSKTYDTFQLGPLSFSIPKGFVTGFIGRNGAGKTSTIRALLSLIKVEGQVEIDGKDIGDMSYLQEIGLVMDEPFLAKSWDMNLVNKAMKTGYIHWQEDQYFSYLDRFSINKKSMVKDLSRGMKIKLMLSIALSHRAKLLILDEPTSGLDPMMRDEFTDIMQEFMEEEDHTILFSTHITQDLEDIADFIAFIEEGKLVDFSTKDSFLDKYLLVKGGLEDLEKIDKSSILGIKKSAFSFEGLVLREDSKIDREIFIAERPSIGKIMTLYRREK